MKIRNTLTAGLLILAVVASGAAAQTKKVDATFTVGTGTCTKSMTLDSGATGEAASELSRANAKDCGLLDAAGDPVMTYFEPDPGDPTKPKKKSFTVADGSSIEYAVTKPLKIAVKDSKGNECCATIAITVICDKTKAGSNLLGKAWLKAVKAVWEFEDDTLKWPKAAPPQGDKKTKTLVPTTSGATGRDYDAYDHVLLHHGGQVVDIPAIPSGFPHTILPQAVLGALPPIPLVGQIDVIQDLDDYGILLKNGFTSLGAFGLFDMLMIDQLEIITDNGPVFIENQAVLVNTSPFDLVVLGTDVLGALEGELDAEDDVLCLGLPPLDFPWTRVPGSGKQASNTAVPDLLGFGTLLPGQPSQFDIINGLPGAPTTFVVGLDDLSAPFKGGILVPTPDFLIPLPLDPLGGASLPFLTPPGLTGLELFTQAWVQDPGSSFGLSATNGVQLVFQ